MGKNAEIMIPENLFYTIILFILYGIFDIAVPAVVLYPYVKDHEFGFRFLFYQIAYLAYLSMMSFALCFIGIYNCFMSWFAFVIIPLGIRAYIERKRLKAFIIDSYKNYLLARAIQENYRMVARRRKAALSEALAKFWNNYAKKYFLDVIVLLLIVFLLGNGLGFFHLTSYTYACSDEPTHIYWVSCLVTGNPFPAGLYPHGMHFVVAQFCSMFGLTPARAWMSFGITSLTIILFSAYLTAYKIFSSKTAGIIGLTIFLCIDLFRTDGWYERLVMVMPMEYAMYAFFIMIYGLISWGENQDFISLLMIGLGLLGTTLIHFFVTILAIFAIIAYILVYHGVMQRNKSIHTLMLCGIATVIIAVLPYAVGMLCGFKLEQSFAWGASTVNVDVGGLSSSSSSYYSDYEITVGNEPIEDAVITSSSISVKDKFKYAKNYQDYYLIISEIMTEYLTSTGLGGMLFLGCNALLFIYGLLLFACSKRSEAKKARARSFLYISVCWFTFFIFLYLGYIFDVLSLVIPTRSSEFISIFSILIFGSAFVMVNDLMMSGHKPFKWFDKFAAVLAVVAAIVLSISDIGINYDDLSYTFTMENIDLKAEIYLSEHVQDETWTYISSTNARMAIHNTGYHYEITDLLRCVRDTEELYIPTPDIYVVVEKYIPYMGNKAVDGSDFISKSVKVSAESANVLLSDVMPIYGGEVNSEVYLGNYSREIIMSHLYYWMEKAKEIYPNEISVFMEDEGCTIYHIKQDEYFLLDLVLDYSDLVERDLQKEQAG